MVATNLLFRRGIVLAAALLCAAPVSTLAQNARQNTPGQFDFYVLALSWSPSYCAAESERKPGGPPQAQCRERPYHFIVHGLWPQFERGFPSYCRVPPPRLDGDTIAAMLDLMPSPDLVIHQWNRHGTCSGLNAKDFFDKVRKARAAVKIPQRFVALTRALTVTPGAIEQAFSDANPGLSRGAIAVACDRRRLREVRICLDKDFGFRDCAEVDRRGCRRGTIVMPPVRGARDARVKEMSPVTASPSSVALNSR